MRWTSIGIVGLGAAALAWINGPLFDPGYYPDSSLAVEFGFAWSAAVIVAPLFIAVVGGTLAAFRALWLSTRRAELASQIALGRTRQSLIRQHVRAGLLDGLIAAGGGALLGGLAKQVGAGFNRVHLEPSALLNYCFLVSWLVLSFVVAYWIAAIWATRGSVRDVASGHRADARAGLPPASKRRLGRRRWWWPVVGLVVVLSFVVVVGPWQIAAGEGGGIVQTVIVMLAATVATLVFYLAVPGLLALGGAKLAGQFSRALSRGIARSANPGSVRSLGADGLARPTPLRTAAAAAVVAVIAVATILTVMVFGANEASTAAEDLSPHASVSTVDLRPGDEALLDMDSGWAQPLPSDLLDSLHADPALIVVEAGVLVTDPRAVPWDDSGEDFTTRDQLLAVDPAALDAVTPSAAKRLYLVDGTQWESGLLGRAGMFADDSHMTVNSARTSVTPLYSNTPWSGISRPWAENLWGPAPTAAVLLYPAGEVSVSEVLKNHDVRGLSLQGPVDSLGWSNSASRAMIAAITAPFLAVAVAIVIALAWSGQRLRARDQATLLALGATPGALRGAAALEAAVLTAVAGSLGLVGGMILGPVLSTLDRAPISEAGIDVLLWNMAQDLAAAPWLVLVGLVAIATAVAAAGAALVRVRLDRLSPAQQLTEASKAGVS